MAKGADAERRFSNLPAAAAVLVCGRRGVLQVLALGDTGRSSSIDLAMGTGPRVRGRSLPRSRSAPGGWLTRHTTDEPGALRCVPWVTATLQQSRGNPRQ